MQTKEEILKQHYKGDLAIPKSIYKAMEHYAIEKQIEVLKFVNMGEATNIVREALTKQLTELKSKG